MSEIKVTFTGAVLDLKIELEGKEVGLYFDGVSKWTRTLQHFKIEGDLDVVMLCKGVNGTAWELQISVNHGEPKSYGGTIKKGYSLVTDQIAIPEQN